MNQLDTPWELINYRRIDPWSILDNCLFNPEFGWLEFCRLPDKLEENPQVLGPVQPVSRR